MKLTDRGRKWLSKKSKGFRGYPIGTLACYGPDNMRASKLVAGVKRTEEAEVELRKWFAEDADLRNDVQVLDEVIAHFREHGVRSVSMIDGIFGCPHEEGFDYPDGESCPECPFWRDRDRFTGLKEGQ